MEDCLFCKIARKDIPADVVYEADDVIAFLDIRPTTLGHTLVVPKAHSANATEVAPEHVQALHAAVQKVAKGVMKGMGVGGVNIATNVGAVSGQVVFHTHVHVIPRFEGDGLVNWGKMDASPEQVSAAAQGIVDALESGGLQGGDGLG